jgi:hypothetical protein
MLLEALQTPVTRQHIRDYYRRERVPFWKHAWAQTTLLALAMLAELGVTVVVVTVAFDGRRGASLFAAGAAVVLGAYFSYLLWWMRRARANNARLSRFAADNGFIFDETLTDPRLAGSAFRNGTNRVATQLIEDTRGAVPFVAGGYRAAIERSVGATMISFGFVGIRLDARVPNIVLTNSRATVLASTGTTFARRQRLSLEGDFDRTFSLHCPVGYERDALYIFTPDLMALLIDAAQDSEVEFIDDWVFIYSARSRRLWNADEFGRLHAAVLAVGGRAIRRTAAYEDERFSGASDLWAEAHRGRVAAGGRRLSTRRVTVGGVIGTVVPWLALVAAAWYLFLS